MLLKEMTQAQVNRHLDRQMGYLELCATDDTDVIVLIIAAKDDKKKRFTTVCHIKSNIDESHRKYLVETLYLLIEKYSNEPIS